MPQEGRSLKIWHFVPLLVECTDTYEGLITVLHEYCIIRYSNQRYNSRILHLIFRSSEQRQMSSTRLGTSPIMVTSSSQVLLHFILKPNHATNTSYSQCLFLTPLTARPDGRQYQNVMLAASILQKLVFHVALQDKIYFDLHEP